MKYYLAAALILISTHTFSQISYTDFIQKDNKIEWAAEYDQILNITPKIAKYRISTFIYNELLQKSCIDNYKQEGDLLKKERFCISDSIKTKDSLLSEINPYRKFTGDFYSYQGMKLSEMELNAPGNKLFRNTRFDILNVKQILSYKDSRLYITNILVTPLQLKNIENDRAKNPWLFFYSTLFNDSSHTLTAKEKASCIDLGNTEAVYNLEYFITDEILPAHIFTLNNAILSHHLIQDILDSKITAVDDNLNVLAGKKIFDYKNPAIKIPTFDDNGNLKGYKMIRNEINIDSFKKFVINQHFYFDTTKQILYSEVNYITFLTKVFTSTGIDLGETDFATVYFTKPALYRKPPAKQFLNN